MSHYSNILKDYEFISHSQNNLFYENDQNCINNCDVIHNDILPLFKNYSNSLLSKGMYSNNINNNIHSISNNNNIYSNNSLFKFFDINDKHNYSNGAECDKGIFISYNMKERNNISNISLTEINKSKQKQYIVVNITSNNNDIKFHNFSYIRK